MVHNIDYHEIIEHVCLYLKNVYIFLNSYIKLDKVMFFIILL